MRKISLSVGLFGPNDANRLAVTRELSGSEVGVLRDYYLQFDIDELIAQKHDVVIIDLDHDPDEALSLVKRLSESGVSSVMVYSVHSDTELTMRALHAGAQEFLVLPVERGVIPAALARALARRPDASCWIEEGQLLTFCGVKGGVGVTTIASNFALLLARESGKETLLIDMDLPLGDVGLNLGLHGKYSTLDALDNSTRLDANFLSQLILAYDDKLSVLPAPGQFVNLAINTRAIDKLVAVARAEFAYVVVDCGSRLNFIETDLSKKAAAVYMVTQTGVPELRNSNRIISQFSTLGPPRLQVVINRYTASYHSLDEHTVEKALTRPADWKIPNDYGTAFRTQNTAKPLAFEDNPISKSILEMARSACGSEMQSAMEKKRGLFGFFKTARA